MTDRRLLANYKRSDFSPNKESIEENYSEQGILDESFNKTYQITVKYHNEPNAKIEARSAKDRKDLEYQLNMDDEVEWYDFDEKQFNESLDQMREKALKLKDNSNAFAILYGYRVKDKEVELEPEEFATEEEYKDRIQQITNSFTKLSDKDPRGNRYGHEHNIEFYTIYPNKKLMAESTTISSDKWNIGSDKSNLTSGEIALLDELAQKLESSSVNGYKYVVQHTYEDFGAGMQWYTIVCYDKKGDSWQVLDTKEWLQLMNTGDIDAVYSEVVSGEYFQDKLIESNLSEMNHRQLMSYMDNLD